MPTLLVESDRIFCIKSRSRSCVQGPPALAIGNNLQSVEWSHRPSSTLCWNGISMYTPLIVIFSGSYHFGYRAKIHTHILAELSSEAIGYRAHPIEHCCICPSPIVVAVFDGISSFGEATAMEEQQSDCSRKLTDEAARPSTDLFAFRTPQTGPKIGVCTSFLQTD